MWDLVNPYIFKINLCHFGIAEGAEGDCGKHNLFFFNIWITKASA